VADNSHAGDVRVAGGTRCEIGELGLHHKLELGAILDRVLVQPLLKVQQLPMVLELRWGPVGQMLQLEWAGFMEV